MPTALPSGEKSAFIAIINTQNPREAIRLASLLNNYEDIAPIGIARQLGVFAGNPALLKEAMAVFTDAALVTVGIYNSKSGTTLTNPEMLINSIYTGVITISTTQTGFGLLGSSSAANITIGTNTQLDNLVIGPGCTVDILDGTASGAFVNNIDLLFAYSAPSFLNLVKYGSKYGNIAVSDGSYFGGVQNIDPTATCAAGPVTAITAGEITHDSIVLMWTPPTSGYLFINTQYKKTESQVWINATKEDGDFIQNAGFVFRKLDSDTYYDFRIQTVCNNGGVAYATISTSTVCCGSGGEVLVADCLVTVFIKTSPDATKKIPLCNGVMIQQEYPEGATLTIPQLAGRPLASDVIISNIPYQNIPFNQTLFQFDLSATPLGEFQDPNIVSFEVRLPL